jgi:hypothetical protein
MAHLALGMAAPARGDIGAAAGDRAAALARHGGGRVEVAATVVGRAELALTAGDHAHAAGLLAGASR